MGDNMTQPSQMDKLIATIRFAIIAALMGAAVYFFGPTLLKKWNESQTASKNGGDAEAQLRKEEELRKKIGDDALANVQRNGSHILNEAYPFAFGKLSYRNAELLGVGANDGGYVATVRLNYLNLFNRPHYLEIGFGHDSQGGYRSSRFVKHTDIIAPKELTLGTLLGGK